MTAINHTLNPHSPPNSSFVFIVGTQRYQQHSVPEGTSSTRLNVQDRGHLWQGHSKLWYPKVPAALG
eukprot:1382436-Amorphochlora_amoeboformis.AAC.1